MSSDAQMRCPLCNATGEVEGELCPLCCDGEDGQVAVEKAVLELYKAFDRMREEHNTLRCNHDALVRRLRSKGLA